MRTFTIILSRGIHLFLLISFLAVFYGKDLQAQLVSIGDSHGMIICPDGALLGSGNNANGEMGTNEYLPNQGLQSLSDDKWMMVACGGTHTLYLKIDSTLWASGQGNLLGLGDYDDRDEPVQVGTDNDWVFIEAGGYTSFGIKENGTLWSWGVGLNGQLGLNEVYEALEPMQIGLAEQWQSVAASTEYTIGLQKDGTIWAWGDNSNGKYGNGSDIPSWFPVIVAESSEYTAIALAEGGHSLALDKQGNLWGTGLNNYGQLGLSQETYLLLEWTKLDSTNKYIEIASGKDHTLAIRDDHTLWATGRNDFGQLGIGSTENSFGFGQVGEQSNWEQVAASLKHSIGISSENELYIWGKNKDWQMPSCDSDGLYQCNQPLLIENTCGSSGGGTSINNDRAMEDLSVYPIPVQDVLYFATEERFDHISLFDISGRIVLHEEQVSNSIDLSSLHQGIFIIEFGKEGEKIQQRIFKY